MGNYLYRYIVCAFVHLYNVERDGSRLHKTDCYYQKWIFNVHKYNFDESLQDYVVDLGPSRKRLGLDNMIHFTPVITI